MKNKETNNRIIAGVRERAAKAFSAAARNVSIDPALLRRGFYLCLSLLLALNIVASMLPAGMPALAEGASAPDTLVVDASNPDKVTVNVTVSDFEKFKKYMTYDISGNEFGEDNKDKTVTDINITLAADIAIEEAVIPHTGKTITVKGGTSGHKLSRHSSYAGEDAALIKIVKTTVNLDNVTVTSEGVKSAAHLALVGGGAVLNLQNGSVLTQKDSASDYTSSSPSAKGAVYLTDSVSSNPNAEEETGIDGGKLIGGTVTECYAVTGGGVYIQNGEVRNCSITKCSAKNGGGIFMSDGMVTGCTVSECTAEIGGGMLLYGGEIQGAPTTVAKCEARSSTGAKGGAIAVYKDGTAGSQASEEKPVVKGNLVISECSAAAEGSAPQDVKLAGSEIYVQDPAALYFSGTPAVTVSECWQDSTFADLTGHKNIVVHGAITANSDTDKAIKAAEAANPELVSSSPERIIGCVLSIAEGVTLPSRKLDYNINLTQANDELRNKYYELVIYKIENNTQLPSGSGPETGSAQTSAAAEASVAGSSKVHIDGTGELSFTAEFDSRDTVLAAVLYPYQYSCKIGSTKYAELSDALSHARGGDTITLLRDTAVTDTLEIAKSNLTIDGDNYTVYRADDFCGPMISSSGNEFTLKDVTLSGKPYSSKFESGKAPVEAVGPLVQFEKGKLNLRNAVLRDNNNISTNTAGEDHVPGGGLYLKCSELDADSDSAITGNKAADGAGIYTVKKSGASEPELIISGIAVTDNTAANNGGGIYADEKTLLKDVTVQDNSAKKLGGGVYAVKDTGICGNIQINNNLHYSGGSAAARSDYYFADQSAPMTVENTLSPSSIIGVKNFKTNSAIAQADGTDVKTVSGLENCFFPDVDSSSTRFFFEPDTANEKIICRSDSNGAREIYTVTASAGDNGGISPSGQMLIPKGTHTFTITPDDGYLIDTVTVSPTSGTAVELYKNGAPVSGKDAGSVRVTDKIGELTLNVTHDCDVDVAFKEASEDQHTVTPKTSGGNSSCTSSRAAGSGKVPDGGSDTITFSTGSNNYPYVLSEIKVGDTTIKPDGTHKKLSDYPEITTELASDGSLKYTYRLSDIRKDTTVEGVFKQVYNETSKEDKDNKVSVSGKYIADDAVLSVKPLASADDSFKAIQKAVTDHNAVSGNTEMKLRQPTSDSYAVYDITMSSDAYDYPYRDELTLKFYVGTDYKGKDAYAFHVTDEASGTVDTTLKGTVGDDGYFTVKTKSLSPYGVIIPSGSPVSPGSGTNGNSGANTNSGTNGNSGTNTNNTNNSGTNSNSGTTNNGSSTVQQTTTNPSTGDRLPPYVVPALICSAAVVIILGAVMLIKKKKNNQ